MLSAATQTKFLTTALTFAPRRVYGIAPRHAACVIMSAREDVFFQGVHSAFATLQEIMPLTIDCNAVWGQYVDDEYAVWRKFTDATFVIDVPVATAELRREVPPASLHQWARAIEAALDISPEERAAMLDAHTYADTRVREGLQDLDKIRTHGRKLYLLAALIAIETICSEE